MGKKGKSRHPKKHSTDVFLNLHFGAKSKSRLGFSFVTVILIIILLVFLISFFGLKINFKVSDELNLILTPKYQSASVPHNEPVTIGFIIKNQNFVQCKSVCNFTLTSLRNNSNIFYETQELKHNEKIEKNFTLYAPAFGSGQELYLYEAECRNLKSLICLTDGKSRQESSVVAVNYRLDENEMSIKAMIKPEIEELLSLTRNLSISLEQARVMSLRLPDAASEKEEIMKKIEGNGADLQDIASRARALTSLWEAEHYYELNSSSITGILMRARRLSEDILIEEATTALILWNNNTDLLLEIGSHKSEIPKLYNFITNETHNGQALAQFNGILAAVIQDYEEITSGSNISQHQLNTRLAADLQSVEYMIAQSEKTKNEGLFLIAYSKAKIETKLNSTVPELNGTICSRLNQTVREILKENEKSVHLREAQYNWSLNNSNFSSELEAVSGQIDYISLVRAETEMTGYYESIVSSQFTSAFNLSQAELYLLAILNVSAEQEYLNKNCFVLTSQINSSPMEEFLSIDFSSLINEKKDVDIPFVSVDYMTELEDNKEKCCTFNECNPCLTSSQPSPTPVLFIHGHAFNEKNTPEYTMNAFAKLQAKLQEEKIINFGELDIGDNTSEGEWAKNNRSLSVRASYYYVSHYNLGSYDLAVQKSEGLENYAIRLKEIIDLVKYRTGAPKVIVIAHSMGGLVVREYGVLFGYESLDKVILINTPNHGITKKIGSLCNVLGSEKECNDMIEGSIFLSKLNSQQMPKVPFYAIRSTGCKMDNNSQGDGIVTEENAYLEGAVNIVLQGECTDKLQTDLHTSVLDPELHPEIYSVITEILLGKNE